MTRTVALTMTLTRDHPYSQDRVWRAISTGALMAEWLLPNDFQPVPGHRFTFQPQAMADWGGTIRAEMPAVDPPRHQSCTRAAPGVVTEVALTLEPTGTGTRLTVAQSGFQPDQAQNHANARSGAPLPVDMSAVTGNFWHGATALVLTLLIALHIVGAFKDRVTINRMI